MATITVHHFKVYDVVNDKWITHKSKRTADSIKDIGGTIIPNTAEDIDDSQLDDQERYYPKP